MQLSRFEKQILHWFSDVNNIQTDEQCAQVAIDLAIPQITDGITFLEGREAVTQLFTEHHSDGRYCTQKLNELLTTDNYKWEDLDKVIALCKTHNAYPYAFTFLRQRPVQEPKTLAEALELLTVPDMRNILKRHEIKCPRKRIDVVEKVKAELTLADVETEVFEKVLRDSQEFIEHIHERRCSLITATILARKDFLKRVGRSLLSEKQSGERYFEPKLLLMSNEADENKLAGQWIDKGYESVIVRGRIERMLPLFPGDRARINYKYQHSNNH